MAQYAAILVVQTDDWEKSNLELKILKKHGIWVKSWTGKYRARINVYLGLFRIASRRPTNSHSFLASSYCGNMLYRLPFAAAFQVSFATMVVTLHSRAQEAVRGSARSIEAQGVKNDSMFDVLRCWWACNAVCHCLLP